MLKGKVYIHIVLALASFVLCFSCENSYSSMETGKTNTKSKLGDYPIQPVNIREVKLTDNFWLPIITTVQEKTIAYALAKCKEEGRLENFLIAGGKKEGEVRGAMPFDDTDIYKVIEGASNSLISSPNDTLQTLLDSLISIIAIGQEEDGYLTTWRTINPAKPPAPWVKVTEGKRWEYLNMSHELYNAGHLYEAASVHHKATGKHNFLDIALKNADLMVQTFGADSTKIQAVPGHQIIETGLIQLYRITAKEAYLKLAKYFLDSRGDTTMNRDFFGPYAQDHQLITEQNEVVGHAVRAMYMYSGMTDIAAIYKDEKYREAVDNLWSNMVNKKMYVTGGIGARHEGESFGKNYELPNLTAYNETCASIGDVYWNHRLFMLTGEAKYFDVIERTLYNGLISGLSLDGKKFFYPNALESDGKYQFNRGACTRQSWFDCSCCPTNLIRFLPSVLGLIYAKEGNTVYVNLYASSKAHIDLNGSAFNITQNTNYPWNGKIQLEIQTESVKEMVLKLRVPHWARHEVLPGDLYHYAPHKSASISLIVNGKKEDFNVKDGYITIDRQWENTTHVELDLPMETRIIYANEKVEEDRGKAALEYGPMVYAFEETDNTAHFDELRLTKDSDFQVTFKPNLLGGINQLELKNPNQTFYGIPYYAWSNRGVGKMKVWIPKTSQNK